MDRPTTSVHYDYPSNECKKTYIIFTNGRTGSSWLSIGLYRAKLGVPMEYFHRKYIGQFHQRGIWNPEDYSVETYIEQLSSIRTTPNGLFGLKIHMNQWIELWGEKTRFKSPSFYRQKLERLFVNPHIIFLYRKDILGQAISMYIANESHSWSSEVPAEKEVEYSFKEINKILEIVIDYIKHCRAIERYTTIPKMHLTYEELEQDYYGSLKNISSFLGEDIDLNDEIGSNTVEKQRDERNAEWKERFLYDMKHM